MIARAHARAPATAVYGGAYSNPDKGYKMAAVEQREVPLIAVGTSRVMQFRSDFFTGGETTFYNAGGGVSRLWDYRYFFKHVRETKTRKVIVGLDQWVFNDHWVNYAPDSGAAREYDGEYSALDVIQRSLKVYSDSATRKLDLAKVFARSDSFGINGITHGNGFLRDGSYVYHDKLHDILAKPGFKDDDVMERVRTGTRRFEDGEAPSPATLTELDILATEWERDGFEVVAFAPPYAPVVLDAMRATGRMQYVFDVGAAIQRVLAAHRNITFFDLTSCRELGCVDDDFIDGFHAGSVTYAKILLTFADKVPWLSSIVDRSSIDVRLRGPNDAWELRWPDQGNGSSN
jgi:hypothetical protein